MGKSLSDDHLDAREDEGRGEIIAATRAIPLEDERSETFARVLGTPLRPHGLRFQSPAGQELHVRGQPRVHVLVRRVAVGRRVAPAQSTRVSIVSPPRPPHYSP